jgi:phage tail tape-measure protein
MNQMKRYVEEIEKILFRAQRAVRPVSPSDEWQRSLMMEIRRLGPLAGVAEEDAAVAAYNRVAWRLLAAACAAAIVLFAFAYTNGFVASRDLAMSLLQDPLATYLP